MKLAAANRLEKIQSYYFSRKLAEIAQMKAAGRSIINLGIGSPDLLPPDEVIHCLQQASVTEDANQYQGYRGIPELRKAFSNWYRRIYGVKLKSDHEVLPLMGSKEGIMHISMSFLNPGDRVLVPNPGYPAYKTVATICGATPIPYNLTEEDNWLPDFESLEQSDLSKIKLMWINYPHMPTGASADHDLFEKLVSFGLKNKILVCHDNPYSLILNAHPRSIMSIPGAFQCCIELNSLSKSYNMAGWRVGVMVAKENFINTVMRFKSNMDSGMYKPIQQAAIKALETPMEWIHKSNDIYRRRKKIGISLLSAIDCDVSRHDAGFFLWAKISNNETSEDFIDKILHETGVFIAPGIIFGSNGEGYVRLSLCNTAQLLEEALQRVSNASLTTTN